MNFLESQRAMMQEELAKIRSTPIEPAGAGGVSDTDQVDAAQEIEGRELSFTQRALMISRVNSLGLALDRIANDDYVVCVACGEPIPQKRLRAVPDAVRCLPCQQRAEK